MTEAAMCSECGATLTRWVYGYGMCDGHPATDFEQLQAYRFDAQDGFGDWEDGPTYLLLPLLVERHVVTIWLSKARCCSQLEDPNESDRWDEWCPKCEAFTDALVSSLHKETPDG